MHRLLARPTLILFALWVFVTALDLGKAFHIDDTFHLQAAQWIEAHPGKPMSGTINWVDDPEPIHAFNQPPGFFYVLAATGHFFGYGELPMHLVRALFSLLAICSFHSMARHFHPERALLLTSLLAVGPAFMVNQGVMTDVPVLALHLLFFRLVLAPTALPDRKRYLLAGLVLSVALLVKYITLPLLFLFPAILLQRAEHKYLPAALLPFITALLWGGWNLHEFGTVHMFERSATDPSATGIAVRGLSLVMCLGAMAPFTWGMATVLLPEWRRALRFLPVVVIIGLGLLAVLVAMERIAVPTADRALRYCFLLNGAMLCTATVLGMFKQRTRSSSMEGWNIAVWSIALAAFLIVFAPNMATRYVLLIFPPLLLMLAPLLDKLTNTERAAGLLATGTLGILLSVADLRYADHFRTQAFRIAKELGQDRTLFAAGHWGWQWYAQQAGMATYATHDTVLGPSDLVIVPDAVPTQRIPAELQLEEVRCWHDHTSAWDILRVDEGSLFTSVYPMVPWGFSPLRERTIRAFQVQRTD